MGNVFANGMEIAGEAMSHKVIAAMPNVCLSPPSPPAGPIPIPYPCFGQASDTDNGTKDITIEGKPAFIKSSSFKKSKGDEACTKSFGMGVVTHSQSGSIKHSAYSFDVKFEGENVCRNLDLVGGNHGSPLQNSADTGVQTAKVKPGDAEEPDCAKLGEKNVEERENVVDELSSQDSLNKQEQTTLDKAESTGMTISSASSQVPGAEGVFTASSSGCAQACNPNGLVSGGTSEQKMGLNAATRASDSPEHAAAKEKAGVLCDKSHVHPGGGAGAHAEPKIINEMCVKFPDSPMRGGSILFNIDWRFKRKGKPKQSGMPCKHCYKMMCHAASECDIQIFICDKDNNPQPLSKDDCNSEDGYENLSIRIDGNPSPGR